MSGSLISRLVEFAPFEVYAVCRLCDHSIPTERVDHAGLY